MEVELKLEVAEDAAASLENAGLLSGEPRRSSLRAIYFDTPDRDVAAAGFSLRIRAADGDRIQTIKADGAAAAGLFVRPEWEAPVADDMPVLDHTSPLKSVLGARAAAIAPVFEVHVERATWDLREDGAEIEMVLDRGQVLAGGRGALVCEIELELNSGTPAALFAFARKLDAIAPVRIGVLSKAERGHRLGRPVRSAFKAEPVVLGDEMDAAAAFRHIVQACVRQFRLNEAVLAEHRRAKPLHQARVALRRLRSAFSLFKPLFERDPQAAALRGELRWLAAALGEARNLDVLLERSGGGALEDRLRGAREDAYARVEAALGSARARGLMLELMEWLQDGPWLHDAESAAQRGEPVREAAVQILDRTRRKVKKGGRRLTKVDDEARHELRKDAKKLRYASEFFASLFDGKRGRRRHKRFVAALEDLQDRLGHLNDLATAPEEMRKLGLEDDPAAQALLGSDSRKHLIHAAARAHDDLLDAKRFWR